MIYPILESIIYTGISWIIIGYVDAHFSLGVAGVVHNMMLVFWLLLLLLRCVLPMIRLRRRKIMVTNQRIILHTAALRGTWESIPLSQVRDVARRRKDIYLAVAGNDRSIYLPKVPKAKRAVEVIEQLIARPQEAAPAVEY